MCHQPTDRQTNQVEPCWIMLNRVEPCWAMLKPPNHPTNLQSVIMALCIMTDMILLFFIFVIILIYYFLFLFFSFGLWFLLDFTFTWFLLHLPFTHPFACWIAGFSCRLFVTIFLPLHFLLFRLPVLVFSQHICMIRILYIYITILCLSIRYIYLFLFIYLFNYLFMIYYIFIVSNYQ